MTIPPDVWGKIIGLLESKAMKVAKIARLCSVSRETVNRLKKQYEEDPLKTI